MKNNFCLGEHITRTILEGLQECFACGAELETNDFKDLCDDCWRNSKGGFFDKKLKMKEKEWEERREHLRCGGEVDFGATWKYIDINLEMEAQLPLSLRLSVRLNQRENKYETYGVVYDSRGCYEISLFMSDNIRQAYRTAILAGPYSNFIVKMIQKQRQKYYCEEFSNNNNNESEFSVPKYINSFPENIKIIDENGNSLFIFYNF